MRNNGARVRRRRSQETGGLSVALLDGCAGVDGQHELAYMDGVARIPGASNMKDAMIRI